MIQINMEKPSACRWTDEENNIHLCPFLDREFDCLIQGHIGYWSWDGQYKNCPLHEVTDSDTISRQDVIELIQGSICDLEYSDENRELCNKVRALPPSPSIKPDTDTISRQQAIDEVSNNSPELDKENGELISRQTDTISRQDAICTARIALDSVQ